MLLVTGCQQDLVPLRHNTRDSTVLRAILGSGMMCTFDKFADDTTLGGESDTPDNGATIHRDSDSLENWSERKCMKL